MTTPDTTSGPPDHQPDQPAPGTPAGPGAAGPDPADAELAARCTSHAQWLAGILATAQLDTLARPDQLPADLYPHMPPEHVTEVWQRALAVGYRAGHLAARPHHHRDTIARLHTLLTNAGYQAMARHTARTAHTSPGPGGGHPADPEQHDTRGGHA